MTEVFVEQATLYKINKVTLLPYFSVYFTVDIQATNLLANVFFLMQNHDIWDIIEEQNLLIYTELKRKIVGQVFAGSLKNVQ